LVGGISIFLTKEILHNGYKIQEESQHIKIFDDLNADAYRLVLAIHHFLIDPDEIYANEAIAIVAKIDKVTQEYRAMEEEETYEEARMEVDVLDKVIADIRDLKNIVPLFQQYLETGKFDRDELIGHEEFAYSIESASKDINIIHFAKIEQWEKESISKMWKILFLYLLFINFGGLSVYIGHRLMSRNVVNPIKELASATTEFAEGTLDKRVYTDSETEIGQLYQSFNEMAAKLQENDELLRKFNEELEKKVKERTVELQNINEQFQRTHNALIRSERIAAVGQIAAGVTHEIKNPLNSLSINTQMLLRELADNFGNDSSTYDTATLIKSEINRINNILEEFVKFAKFPEPQPISNDINQVAREVADLISESAKESGVTVSLSLQENIPKVIFDDMQFREVLINLTQNAITAMKHGGTLEIKTSLDEENLVILVSDTGEGVPEKNIERIFSPFFSTREDGLGLGLSIVQRIVESHGGKITCSSNMGEGTVFEILLHVERIKV
jgi:signal transduction histidine kinase